MNMRNCFTHSARLLTRTRSLTLAAMLIALNVALSSVRVQITPELRLSLGFITQAASGMLLGPVCAMLTGAASDILSHICFPTGAYFPGYTLTAVVGGLIYGVFLFERPRPNYLRALLVKGVMSLVCNIGLNTLWISLTGGQAMLALLPARLIKNLCLLPIEALLIYMTAAALTVALRRSGLMRGARD
jgi:riboflavin transporter